MTDLADRAPLDRHGSAAPPGPSSEPPAPTRRRRPRRWVLAVAAVAVAVPAVAVTRRSSPIASVTPAQVAATVKAAVDKAAKDAAAAPTHAATVYQAILPSVVVIRTERAGTTGGTGTAGGESDGLGTGVVINAQGSILTARHVIAGATAITVRFADGTQAPAHLVSEQPANDTAVVAADTTAAVIVPATLGSSRGLRVGDEVFALGHPLGLTDSLTAGVVSGLDRSAPLPDDGPTLTGLIQFDAAVNPGNSGGPLLNRSGQVVGIVTALANPTQQGFFIGIGFAVPIATAAGGAGGPAQ